MSKEFKRLEKLHNEIQDFAGKLADIYSVDEKQTRDILDEVNFIIAPCGSSHGQYTYLFEAAGERLCKINKDF